MAERVPTYNINLLTEQTTVFVGIGRRMCAVKLRLPTSSLFNNNNIFISIFSDNYVVIQLWIE